MTMEFDEYEYLEKTVETSVPANGSSAGEKERRRRSSGDGERRSKRSRSEEGGGERERDRRHHRSSPDRERHRSSREHRDREKEKERARETEKERARDRDREKEREKERVSERESERDRRSRSARRREEEAAAELHRERSRDRELRPREFGERDREIRRKKDEATEPEADPERDQRTVFAYQLSLKADERDVYEFFSRAGKVRDVRLIMDRNSRRSKGVGYIEFYDVMSVPMAIALSGQLLLGQPVMVKPSEAEKNLVPSSSSSGSAASGGPRKLYVGNLHTYITEDQLRQVFEAFGPIELIQLPLDPLTGLCKGFGFIQFARLEDAKAAQSLNGQLDLAGRTIKVSAVTEQPGAQVLAGTTGDLDDDEGGGLSLNASSRALLMQKLDRSGITTGMAGTIGAPTNLAAVGTLPAPLALGATPISAPVVQPAFPVLGAVLSAPYIPAAGSNSQLFEISAPSECLLLKNMFDPNVETEPDFELDIRDDVQEECSKYGSIRHIFVDKNSAGFVYLRFDSATSAISAQRALHGRWFARNMITATFLSPQQYEVKFPDSRN